jgi:dihydrofolate reductase
MTRVIVFNQVSLDGYFSDANGDASWAHKSDPEWNAFVAENASGGGTLAFGRITYEMMASFWPTPTAQKLAPVVAKQMSALPKVVFSRTLKEASWENTTVIEEASPAAIRKLKKESARDIVIMGSGSIVAQLAEGGLIDEYQLVVNPIVLGSGRTLFEGVTRKLALRRTTTRMFENGNVLLCYAPDR